ncbi:hypothetical protein ACH0BF_24925 [Pseudobacillus sp. 179-B 2D1 NHS]|uniref:hypothetical protein n=1 Tax=Pseudobacillus sp. 179-B 2D1 NHS TaxID=3374292 RepID=UPI0038793175
MFSSEKMVKRFISTLMVTGVLIEFSMTEQSIVKASEPTQAEIDAMYAQEDAEAAYVLNNWNKVIDEKIKESGIDATAAAKNPDYRPGDIWTMGFRVLVQVLDGGILQLYIGLMNTLWNLIGRTVSDCMALISGNLLIKK